MEINEFAHGYLNCALWASIDDMQKALDDNYSIADIAPESLAKELALCAKFEAICAKDLEVYYEYFSNSSAGHDFFLTSRGHGVGFWDRGYGLGEGMKKVCAKLTEVCRAYSGEEPYVGDDGKIYFY